jgi:hypothetical protein
MPCPPSSVAQPVRVFQGQIAVFTQTLTGAALDLSMDICFYKVSGGSGFPGSGLQPPGMIHPRGVPRHNWEPPARAGVDPRPDSVSMIGSYSERHVDTRPC